MATVQDCKRCEFMHHSYNNSPCPRQDKTLYDLAIYGGDRELIEKAIKECLLMEQVRAPMSWWTKKEILTVCKNGGASYNVIRHMEKIPLEDLKLIVLKKLSVEPRGMHSEIWKLPKNQWEHVRNTQMWGINWDQIDEWNRLLK